MFSALLTSKKAVAGRRKKKVRGDRQWGGRVYVGRHTDAGGYLAFFSVAGTRHVTDSIMRILELAGSNFFTEHNMYRYGQKKKARIDRAMPIRQSGTWVGGEMSLIF